MPRSIQQLKVMEEMRLENNLMNAHFPAVQSTILEDQSTLLFQKYHPKQALFSDLYWIRSADEIYRMKALSNPTQEPIGHQVDHLKRNSRGQLAVVASFAQKAFPEIHFNRQNLLESLISPKEFSLIELWKKLPSGQTSLSDRAAQILTLFYRRLAMPWLCLLAIIAPAPFCLVFTRRLSVFFIYCCSIFGLATFYLLINAATVLGETQTLPPIAAIVAPFTLVFGGFLWKYVKYY